MKKTLVITIIAITLTAVGSFGGYRLLHVDQKPVATPKPKIYRKHIVVKQTKKDTVAVNKYVDRYKEISKPTPNIGDGVNDVKGIILHHTAVPTGKLAVERLCSRKAGVSSHVVIDTDGTRYILAKPTAITWHAGFSRLNGRESCNKFTIGIEFQGNTLKKPLTDAQIESGIEYILPLMKKYDIPKTNIVTHAKIRKSWMKHHPDEVEEKCVHAKVDITSKEYRRFMQALEKHLQN